MTVRCFKCLEDLAVVASREGPKKSYCRTCFLDIFHKNVRDAFFRQCRIPPNTPIVLAVSGGTNSMAMMHSLGLLRVQNATRGGAGKIDFDMHVLHLTGDDFDPVDPCTSEPKQRSPSHSRECAESVVKACTAIAPLHHVPQATTTKRRVQEKKQREAAGQTDCEPANTVPLFEPSRVFVKKFSEYLPKFNELYETFFCGADHSRPLTSVAMAEDLIHQLRMKAIVSAAEDIVEGVRRSRGTDSNVEQPFLLLLGDSAVKSGVEALYQLTRGRGQSITDHCGYRGKLFGKVLVRRPMRGLLPKENLFYCRIEGLATHWTPVPAPHPEHALSHDPKNFAERQALWRLLQFCIATVSVHRDLTHMIVAAVKRLFAGTPLAIVSHKQKGSVRSLLEDFVLNLSDGSYRSAIFNIIHSVDKMGATHDMPHDKPIGLHHDNGRGQPRFGPKNAEVFAETATTTQAKSCSLCGGQALSGEKEVQEKWFWCRSCRQVLRPVLETFESPPIGNLRKETNELFTFLLESDVSQCKTGLIRMSSEEIRSEIAEFLLNNDDDL